MLWARSKPEIKFPLKFTEAYGEQICRICFYINTDMIFLAGTILKKYDMLKIHFFCLHCMLLSAAAVQLFYLISPTLRLCTTITIDLTMQRMQDKNLCFHGCSIFFFFFFWYNITLY